MLTSTLRKQHVELAELLHQIASGIHARQPGGDLRRLLVDLGGKLTVHLAAEDRIVYPKLQASQNLAIAAMAKRFSADMGGLAMAFKDFSRKYHTGLVIDGDRNGFAAAFGSIVAAISARVKAEEDDLYAAVDRLAELP